MRKIALLLLPVIIMAKFADAQINWAIYSQSFPAGVNQKDSAFGIITAVPEINNSFWTTNPNAGLQGALANDTAFRRYRPKDFGAINTFDTAKAQFFLHGVNKKNAAAYEYRVTECGGKEIIPWGAITRFTDAALIAASGMPQMAYLGGYKTKPGNKIIVDVRKKGIPGILATAVVRWVPIRPLISAIYTPDELNVFFKILAHPWSYRDKGPEQRKWAGQYPEDQLDKLIGLPQKMKLKPADNALIFYLSADIYNKEQVEYELVKNNKVVIGWRVNDFENNFVWLKDLSHGDYAVNIRYSAQRQHVTDYLFEIETPWYQSAAFRIIAGILACAFMGFVLFLILHLKQKKQAEIELSKKTKLQLELKAIHAQLNPHFIFNALSSIQGLMNKQDINGANIYLTDFARLLRSSLNNSNREQTSLNQEIITLDTYLKLEQLRFGFTYHINVDENINIYETDIPALLLQPLIENAVKHGVSGMQEKGIIAVSFSRQQNNMAATINDNGAGLDAGKNTEGFGLKLTRDRIKLLNELTREQSIAFEINKISTPGTQIEITFKNWFL